MTPYISMHPIHIGRNRYKTNHMKATVTLGTCVFPRAPCVALWIPPSDGLTWGLRQDHVGEFHWKSLVSETGCHLSKDWNHEKGSRWNPRAKVKAQEGGWGEWLTGTWPLSQAQRGINKVDHGSMEITHREIPWLVENDQLSPITWTNTILNSMTALPHASPKVLAIEFVYKNSK